MLTIFFDRYVEEMGNKGNYNYDDIFGYLDGSESEN